MQTSGRPRGGERVSLRLVDEAASTVSVPLVVGKDRAATFDDSPFEAGDSKFITALFPAVSGSSVSVMVPGFGLIEVPVVPGDSASWPQEAKDWLAASPAGQFVSIDSWATSLVTQTTAEVAGDEVMVALPSDVLFAGDKHELSKKAAKVVDKAGAKIAEAAAESGEITVIGHTDDQADEAYNQKLSERRALAVAERLRPILGSAFAIKTEGRGESDPAVSGTDDDARAANRRVEVQFTRRSAGKLVVVDDVPTELPETTGTVVSGLETAVVQAGVIHSPMRTRMVSLERRGNFLVGMVEVATDGEQEIEATQFFGEFNMTTHSRGHGLSGPGNLALLTPTSRVHPADMLPQGPEGERYLLGDNSADLTPTVGWPHRYVVVWPDTDPTATTVTIDAPGMYRFVDVPIS